MSNVAGCDLVLSGNDSALLTSDKTVSKTYTKLQNNLASLSLWLEENRLSLHIGKTESILFGSMRKLSKTDSITNQCKGRTSKATSNVKYLGSMLDYTLAGDKMYDNVLKCVNSGLKILHRGNF